MDHAEYALKVFQQHFAQRSPDLGTGFVALELGPGDSLASAVIARAYGAEHMHLVDVGSFATTDVSVYQEMERDLRRLGLDPPSLGAVCDVDSLLRVCCATYRIDGLQSLRDIPSGSVDILWSHAVLEHIRRAEFSAFVREMRRVLRLGGVCSHQVDLKDHLGGALNNLRIPSRWWEAEWMARSGFYTNRLRKSEMLAEFESAGFRAEVFNTSQWATIPTPREQLTREFHRLDTEDLLCSGFSVVLRPM